MENPHHKRTAMILPIVKKQIERRGTCSVPETITYGYDSATAKIGAEAFADFVCGAEYAPENARIEFCLDASLEARDEIYSLTVTENKISVGFRDARGAVNGAATAALLLRKQILPCQEIVDYPDFAYRSFLLDFARGVPTEDDIFSTLRQMALAKYNRVHLHLIDSYGPRYVSDALPEYTLDPKKGKPCTKAFLQKIADVCKIYAIEIVPELEIPAHGTALCRAHPEFSCLAEGNLGWSICPGNDDVWDFYRKLVAEIVEIFPNSEYIHVGTDELEMSDLDPKYYCYWDTCPRCAALRNREGLADKREEFYYVVEKCLHGKIAQYYKSQLLGNGTALYRAV